MNEKNFSFRAALIVAYAGVFGFYGGLVGLWVVGLPAMPIALTGGVMALIGIAWLGHLRIRSAGR